MMRISLLSRNREKGMALIMVLLVTMLLVILTSTLVMSNITNLNMISRYRDRTAALELCESGANTARFIFSHDPEFKGTYSSEGKTPYGHYKFTFVKNEDPVFFSVNNLTGSDDSPDPNFRGEVVSKHCADLVITARVNSVTRRVHVILKPGMDNSCAVSTMGKVDIIGNCVVWTNNVKDFPAKIHSNYRTQDENDSCAVNWDPITVNHDSSNPVKFDIGGNADVEAQGTVSCINGARGKSISNSIHERLEKTGDIVDENAPRVTIPKVDVKQIVNDAMDNEDIREVTRNYDYNKNNDNDTEKDADDEDIIKVPKTAVFDGTLSIHKEKKKFNGNYVVIGNIDLDKGDLYINGDLTIYGSIIGTGTIYVGGKTHVIGGEADITTSSDNGATIMGHGDVTMKSYNTRDYLNVFSKYFDYGHEGLFDCYKSIRWRINQLDPEGNLYDNITKPPTAEEIDTYCKDLAGGTGEILVDSKGNTVQIGENKLITKFVKHLNMYLESHPGDKVIREIRDNFIKTAGDLRKNMTNQEVREYFKKNSNPLRANPFEFEKHRFNGVIYSNSDLNIRRGFEVRGMVMTRGRITMKTYNDDQENKIVYNDKYQKAFCRAASIYEIRAWEEL